MPKLTKASSKPSARARFTNADFKGDYAFAGTTDASKGILATGGIIGRFAADGRGHITDGVMTLAGGGELNHESLTCTYTVSPNGMGSMACNTVRLDGPRAGEKSSATFEFVLADGGREFFSVVPNPGDVQGLVSIGQRQ